MYLPHVVIYYEIKNTISLIKFFVLGVGGLRIKKNSTDTLLQILNQFFHFKTLILIIHSS